MNHKINLSKYIWKNWLVLSLVLIIFSTRILLFNEQAKDFWADEGRYPILVQNLMDASKGGNLLLPIQRLFNVDARPGAGLFYYPSAILDVISPSIPFSLYYNLIVNILILILIFLVIKKIQNTKSAVLVTLLLTLSLASSIYIRHTLPYDIALLLLVGGLYFYIYFKKVFIFGVFAGLSFITYPSYYYYIIPIPFILLLYEQSLKKVLPFIFGILAVLFLTQFVSTSIAESSYFQSLKDQSGGVTAISQGDYLPAFSYISEYIISVDGYLNLFLVLALFPGIFFLKHKREIVFFAAYLIIIFLILETFSHILKMHVLYGRTIRPLYLLSLGLSGIVFLKLLESLKTRRAYLLGIGLLLILTILNWLPRFLLYKNITYPQDFKINARNLLNSKNIQYQIEDALFVNYWNTETPDQKLVWHFFKPGDAGKYYTLNAIQTFPYYGNFILDQFCSHEVIIKEPHIQFIYKPYRFEGYKKDMREKMDSDPLYYQLIQCN